MNRAHHHHQPALIQAMFPGPMRQNSRQKGDLEKKKKARRGGLLIKVCLTSETISIKRRSALPCKTSVCVLVFQQQTVRCMHDTGLIFGPAIPAADVCIVKRRSHTMSQPPHFRFPPFLFIASTVSHNAQELPIYLGYLRLVGA